MFQAYEGHCVKCRGELATLEYFDIQEEFLEKYQYFIETYSNIHPMPRICGKTTLN